ncbi:glucokinase [Halopenitus malekzadehii]|uniref:Glucokinase n=1 Tax=Halopenitus malekzadehii TaxID=1267564 RepID=A0A1H6I333_9EURY|nr:ROK family protein [Halopenitus malekzadehii]SEH42967.1 glucokinase [Halopenitus malekzadehii]
MPHYVGVDLGASNVRAAVGDETATISASAREPTPDGPTGEAVTEAVREVVRAACAEAAVDPAAVAGAGLASMGRLDVDAGTVTVPSNLGDDIDGIRLVEPVATLLDLDPESVTLRGDTQAGAIGDRFHAHPAVDDLVYLTISSGIGAGVIADGDLLRGRNSNAGEVGHQTIDADGTMTCGCGQPGHWEAYCSGNNIPRFARRLFEEGTSDTALPIDDESFTAADVFAYAGRDAFADHVIDRVTALNVLGVANVVHAYAPDVVTLSGAVVTNNPDTIVDPIRDRLPPKLVVDTPEVTVSDRGDAAVLEGALVLALPDDVRA